MLHCSDDILCEKAHIEMTLIVDHGYASHGVTGGIEFNNRQGCFKRLPVLFGNTQFGAILVDDSICQA